jgi:hypothetical protein
MRRFLFSAGFVLFFITLSSCALTEKSLREKGISPLSQSELQALYSQPRTIQGMDTTGVRGTGTYTLDGEARLQWSGGLDEGRWRIKAGKFCTTFPTLYNGQEHCFTVYKTGDNEYKFFNPDGSFHSTFSFTK